MFPYRIVIFSPFYQDNNILMDQTQKLQEKGLKFHKIQQNQELLNVLGRSYSYAWNIYAILP